AVKFATRRLQLERGFDRRLEWYESVIEALDSYRFWLRDYLDACEQDLDQSAHRSLAKALLGLERFLELKHLGRLYATTVGFTALSTAIDACSKAGAITDEDGREPQ